MALPLCAGDCAVLSNGFRICAGRHEVVGTEVRLITGERVTVLARGLVARVEAEEPAPVKETPVVPAPVTAPVPPALPDLVRAAAERHGLPPELLHSVANAESAYRADAVSPKGAIGVMQLMPGTATALSADPWNPAENIEAGTRLLRELLIKYDWSANRALAAYNAGPGAVDRFNGMPPYRETQLYVDRVLRDYQRLISRKSTIERQIE